MGGHVIIFVFAILAAGYLGAQRLLRHRRERAWEAAAAATGLAVRPPDPFIKGREELKLRYRMFTFTRELAGEIDQIQVNVTVLGEGLSRQTRVSGRASRGCREISFGADSSVKRKLSGPDPVIGDPDFDDAVRITGDEAACASVLDEHSRGHLRRFVARGGRIEDGLVILETPRICGDAEVLAGLIRAVVEIARSSSGQRGAPEERLAKLVTSDPLASVRRRAFELLEIHHGGTTALEDVARQALGDDDETLRLRAALHLDDTDQLSTLARTGATDEICALALERVATPDDAAAAMELLKSESQPVVAAAARTLGRVGPTRSIGPLREASTRSGRKSAATRALREAIHAIEARAGDIPTGGLTIVGEGGPEGGLSVSSADADADTGRPPEEG